MKFRQFAIGAIASVGLGFLTSGMAAPAAASSAEFTPAQVSAMHKIIYDYIVNNPKVLVAASVKLREQAAKKEQAVALAAIKSNAHDIFANADSPVGGNPKGTVTLVEFFDYQCGHCKEMEPVVEKVMAANKNLRVVYKELPIFGADSQFAAKAALAANKQGKYQAFHQALMKTANPLNNAKVLAAAKKVGLNMKQLDKDMKSPEIDKVVKDDFKLAQKLQLVGTPAFIVGNRAGTEFKFIPGATSQAGLEAAIQSVESTNAAAKQ
ncbi:MAG: DsbA family protein [Coxiellaceae bacterium]|nr:DsbA family protein [Coxiellaceae bacterium]